MQLITKILILDSDPEMRCVYELLLGEKPDMHVVGCMETTREAICLATMWDPDILVTNIFTLGGTPYETVREVVRLRPKAKVIYASACNTPPFFAEALTHLAHGYQVKPFEAKTFVRALRTVADGGVYLTDSVRAWMIEQGGFRIPEWWERPWTQATGDSRSE